MAKRTASVKRKTKETSIKIELNIDGSGQSEIKTGIDFLDHMLELFAFWGHFDLNILAQGDINVDNHHTNEDIGIVLGQVFKEALGNKEGINRNGFASVPMEEVVARVTVDISGRVSFRIDGLPVGGPYHKDEKEGYALKDAEHFFESLAKHLGMNLNVNVENFSPDLHTTLEPIFKALGKALDQATQIDPRRKGVPSTKGVID